MSETRSASHESRPGAGTAAPVFENVLCALDGTPKSYAAVEQAAVLAAPDGHLTLLAVTAVSGSGAWRSAAISDARARRILEQASDLAADAGVAFTQVVEPKGPPFDVIVGRAYAHDLLALGSPDTSWLQEYLGNSVGAGVLNVLSKPLLAARPPRPGQAGFACAIIVASDGSQASEAVVEMAGAIAEATAGHVTLVHADGDASRPPRVDDQAERLNRRLDGRSELLMSASAPPHAIIDSAHAAHASLIVMGTRGAGGLHAIGSTSRHVLHDAPCSALLVPVGAGAG